MIPHIGLSERDFKSPNSNNKQLKSISVREISKGWNQYRGPNRNGHAPEQGVSLSWGTAPSIIWKTPCGEGHSSVLTDTEFVYTLEQNGDEETLYSRNLSNGKVNWKFFQKTKWNDMMGGPGPRSTPTLLNGKLYALFSNGMLCRIDAETGKPDWKIMTINTDYEFPEWGISCSPLIWKDRIILNLGGEKNAVTAYSIDNGNLIWESDFHGSGVYISPSILNMLGEDHLIAAVEGKIAGINPKNGKTLWEKPWKIFLNNAQIVQPIALSDSSFLLAAGYGKGAECFSVKKDSGSAKYSIISQWKSKNLKAKFSNPVLKDGYLYGLSENLLVCLDAKTGELKWRGKKYGYGRVLISGNKLLVLGNTGVFSIAEATPKEFTEIYSQPLLSNVRCWNGPALVGGYLIAMNGQELSCFDLAKSP